MMKQGIVMEIQANRAYIFTNECILVKVAARKDMFIGQSILLPEPAAVTVHRRRWMIPCLAAACLVLLLSTGYLLSAMILPKAGTVYLSLDINPSVEFVLDSNRKVTDVIPMNSDAWTLLGNNDFKGLSYGNAILEWVVLVREKMPGKLNQLLISAVLTSRDRSFIDELMALDSDVGGLQVVGLANLKVKVLYSVDRQVKDDADANNLSFGRQMLLNKALEKKLELTADDIRNASLQFLFESLLNLQTSSTTGYTTSQTFTETTPSITTTRKETTTESTTETTTETTTEATTEATTKATTKTTTKVTTKATEPYGERALTVVENGEEGWTLKWTQVPSELEFKYYKVVISKYNSAPMYSADGYLYALSRGETSCCVNNSRCYNNGDFGGYLVPGQQYFVAITYVYADSKLSSNVLKLTYSGPAAPEETTAAATEAFNPNLSITANDETGISLGWTISPEYRQLSYYKVVISQNTSNPVYPDQGYLYVLSREETACKVSNSQVYSGNCDFGGYLVPGQSYYFAITYVFSDGDKVSSNVHQLTYNGPEGPAE